MFVVYGTRYKMWKIITSKMDKRQFFIDIRGEIANPAKYNIYVLEICGLLMCKGCVLIV